MSLARSSIVRARVSRAQPHAPPQAPRPPVPRPAATRAPVRLVKPAPQPAPLVHHMRPRLATLQGIAPLDPSSLSPSPPAVPIPTPSIQLVVRTPSAMDAAFVRASRTLDPHDPDLAAPPVNRKDTEAARQRRAHLRKYVLAVTLFCALILVIGVARALIGG
jgi:hypothetical protein